MAFCFKLNSMNTGIHAKANLSFGSDITISGVVRVARPPPPQVHQKAPKY